MKLQLPLAAVFAALLGLSACGGGNSSSSTAAAPVTVPDAPQLSIFENQLGTGNAAGVGNVATVTYTGWLYSDIKADHKGTQFDTGTFSFTLGSPTVVSGFDQGVTGMKVGGKRTVFVPSSLGYGTAGGGNGKIPANAGLVFDIELTKLQ